MTEQPPILPYEPPPGRPYSRGKRFFAAFGIGVLVSGIAWVGGWNWIDKGGGAPLLFIIPGLKVLAFIVLMLRREWQTAAMGVLVSIPVGFGIFFSVCASNLRL